MSRLTLSIDHSVVELRCAKRYAHSQGISFSALVENYLDLVSKHAVHRAPATRALGWIRGSLKKADMEDYRQHLIHKYR